MKGSVLRKVKNDKLKELYDTYVAKLRTGADVKIDDAKVSAIEVQGAKQPMGPSLNLSPTGGMRTPPPMAGEEDLPAGEPVAEHGDE
jgi:hypothetical protein